MYKTYTTLLFGLAGLLLGACSQSPSSEIEPTAFFGTLSVNGDSTAVATCSATWQVGGSTGTYIQLSGTDKTTCSNGTTEVTMNQDTSVFNQVSYTTNTVPYKPGTTYTITLYKDNQTYASKVLLPGNITITNPTTTTMAKKGDTLPIAWSKGGANIMSLQLNWQINNDTGQMGETSPDTGMYTAPVGFAYTNIGPTPITGNASATLTLTSTAYGTYATGLNEGTINGTQQNSVTFTLIDGQ